MQQLTDKRGVDVVFNGVGGSTLATDPKVIKPLTGRWVLRGFAAGRAPVDPYAFIYNSITIRTGSVMTLEGTEAHRASRRFLDNWLRSEPLIEPGHVFELADINAAFDLLQQQRAIGKVVLRSGDGS